MRRRHIQLIYALFGLVLLQSGCGGQDPGRLGVIIQAQTTRSVSELTRVQISAHDAQSSCYEVRLSGPSRLGAHFQTIDLSSESEQTVRVDGLGAGAYRLVVWGFISDAAVMYGCAPNPVNIIDGEKTDITITLEDYNPI